MASRALHFIWLLDCSGSMQAVGRMQALNEAIRAAIPAMQRVSRDFPEANVYVNAIRFGDEASWLAGRLIPISEFTWQDLAAGGLTALGEALGMVADTLQAPLISGRALPPILLLVTDGLPTDDFQKGFDRLMAQPWGKRSLRLAVTLGKDGGRAEVQEILRSFVSSDLTAPLQAHDAASLADALQWTAIVALKSVCAPSARRTPESASPPPLAETFVTGVPGW